MSSWWSHRSSIVSVSSSTPSDSGPLPSSPTAPITAGPPPVTLSRKVSLGKRLSRHLSRAPSPETPEPPSQPEAGELSGSPSRGPRSPNKLKKNVPPQDKRRLRIDTADAVLAAKRTPQPPGALSSSVKYRLNNEKSDSTVKSSKSRLKSTEPLRHPPPPSDQQTFEAHTDRAQGTKKKEFELFETGIGFSSGSSSSHDHTPNNSHILDHLPTIMRTSSDDIVENQRATESKAHLDNLTTDSPQGGNSYKLMFICEEVLETEDRYLCRLLKLHEVS